MNVGGSQLQMNVGGSQLQMNVGGIAIANECVEEDNCK